MVTRWGMGRDPQQKSDGPSGRGNLSFFAARRDGTLPSELQAAATRAMGDILDDAYRVALGTLIDNLEMLRRIAVYLVTNERIDGDTFDALFEGRIDVVDADGDWRPATARPRDWTSISQLADVPADMPPPAEGVPGVLRPAPGIAQPTPGGTPAADTPLPPLMQPPPGSGPLAPDQAPAANRAEVSTGEE